ncbi:HEAT repeat domain-containing protein [Paenibacillus hodogayensis]|uniref:HEAT repeat domain-containing protein n=1 Tax=Paenibacillus hodogayensis TaxID=279208 RepID=A0ABV5W052_9BACL
MSQGIPYVRDLLHRMTIKTDEQGREVRNSQDQMSWKALREAERLDDPALIDASAQVLEEAGDDETRANVCFLWSHLAKNTGDARAVRLMLDEFAKTTKMQTKSRMMWSFARVPEVPDAEPFLALSESHDGSLRREALRVLARCRPEEVKDRLIEIIRRSNDEYDVIYTLWALKELRLGEALPGVLALVESPSGEIRSLAIRFAAEFGEGAHVPLFVAALENDRSPDVKWSAMEALDQWGGASETETVLRRVKTIVSRQRKGGGQLPMSELMHGISFLWKVVSNREDVTKLLHALRTSKADKLFEHEAKWLADLVSQSPKR